MGGCYSAPSSNGSFGNRKKTPSLHCLPSSYTDDDDDDERDLDTRPSSPLSILDGLPAVDFLQRYRLGDELGRGEFGVTRRCSDNETGETLACKIISKRKIRSMEDMVDVRREVEIMKTLSEHPNIVSLREAYEDGESVYLIMEVCEGGELFDRIVAKGHYSERAAANVAKTIVEVVQVTELPCQRFTEVVGSPYYIAPEVLKRSYGPEIDVWNLTCHTYDVPQVVAEQLPIEEAANIKKIFCMMDKDKNGTLTFEELKEGLHIIGNPVPEPDIKMLLEVVSILGD
ncbi:hypothetical protein BHE74_00051493 [Ensete ventricosum]|uniref:Uncharacterized protein n=1 Tax=Ensete ventricosum TaxID=4639 RepID=A0A426YJJ1_ENSVE|nr:hypothetical protein B296_00050818 [Ensete ventricosum]RWW28327.1 hypothetical protein GW17_00007202 [Ensete ventricosum]RWW42906.1 hypothetical protein BHE74_00051493 [Ensete ventricosum]RZR88977.1 hypothetical protein BHM03_00016637 [Ensete ventricosum]